MVLYLAHLLSDACFDHLQYPERILRLLLAVMVPKRVEFIA